MVDWKEIHPDFTPELQKEWEKKGFGYEQAKEWIDAGLQPNDADYTKWLKDIKKVSAEWLINHGDEEYLKENYARYQTEHVNNNESFSINFEATENWKNIHPDFTSELQREWEDKGFSSEQIKEWLNIDLKAEDSGFCAWLRDEKKITPSEILGQEEFLREQYREYCKEVVLLNYSQQTQNIKNNIENFFSKWSSFIAVQQKLVKIQKWINCFGYSQLTSVSFSLIGAGLTFKYNGVGASLCLVSTTVSLLSELGKKRFQEEEKRLKNLSEEERVMTELISDIEDLQNNYQELIKIFAELSLWDKKPTNSEKVNHLFLDFLTKISEMRKDTDLHEHDVNEDEVEQGIFEEIEQGLVEERRRVQTLQTLHTSWKKYEINETIDNLFTEMDNYHKREYQIEVKKEITVATGLKRRKSVEKSMERKKYEIYELVDLQVKEELQTQIEIPPK